MNRASALLAAALVTASLPAAAQSGYDNSVRVFFGQFEPEADSSYWNDTFNDFSGDASDFDDIVGGVEYSRALRGNLRLVVSGLGYEGSGNQEYRDFVDSAGDPILHSTTLTLSAATVGLAVDLAPRHAPVIPFVGVGGGLYAWELIEEGDFIDFVAHPPEVFGNTFDDDGATLGWYWTAGVTIPTSSSFALFVQGTWHHAEDDLEGDFADLGTLDLSGRQFVAGLSWSF